MMTQASALPGVYSTSHSHTHFQTQGPPVTQLRPPLRPPPEGCPPMRGEAPDVSEALHASATWV